MSKIRIGMAVAVMCAVTFASITLVAQDNSAREAKDRAEIEELMWRYTRALDTGDGTAYASTYTVDGQFGAGANGEYVLPVPGVLLVLRQKGFDVDRPRFTLPLGHGVHPRQRIR